LGSGLGGLNWKDVRVLIEQHLAPLSDVAITVFEPTGERDPAAMKNREVPRMTAGRAALVGLVNQYLGGLLDPFVTLLEVHKLLYFMQEAGEPLRLRYVKAPYGPYAENLRHVLIEVEGHLTAGYEDGGDAPDKPLTLVPGAIEEASSFLRDHPDTMARFAKVASLVQGFETPFGLELLSTVHWITVREGVVQPAEVVKQTYAWNDRKKQFSERQINLALEVLAKRAWIS
jgi:uncharacterized protein YwgA